MTVETWDVRLIPDLVGRTALVTGATSGIGEQTARVLASKNANVILAVRDVEKGEWVAASIRQSCPGASGNISVGALDLASLASVRAFAEKLLVSVKRLDLLVNNAGVMLPPKGSRTEDGFELQFGTNHLGHFALTGRLAPLLYATEGSRIVTVSSLAHKSGRLDFSDLNWERRKIAAQAYCDSKLANMYFTYELVRRLKNQGRRTSALAAHPGWTSSSLARHSRLVRMLHSTFAQGVEIGALPTLRAACDPGAQPGDHFGPAGFREMRGPPVRVKSSPRSYDLEPAGELWEISERMTGVSF